MTHSYNCIFLAVSCGDDLGASPPQVSLVSVPKYGWLQSAPKGAIYSLHCQAFSYTNMVNIVPVRCPLL